MPERCSLGDKDVVESASGLGRTAKEILAAVPRSYIGVDSDAMAAARVNEAARPVGGFCRQGDAAKTGLDDACPDAVIGEAMLTVQSPHGKAEIVAEVVRILWPGGTYVIHELGLAPDDIDPEIGLGISKASARSIHVNVRPMALVQWGELLIDHRLAAEQTNTASMVLLKLGYSIADEGITGVLRMARNLITQPDLRRRVMSVRRIFTKYESSMRGVALVARRPPWIRKENMIANPVLSCVHSMASMIEINEAAAVSCTIMKAETYRAVLFSFDRDQALSEHTAAMPAVVQVLERRLRIDVGGQSVEPVPGDILHFGTCPPHAVFALEPSKMLLLILDSNEKGGKEEE